ncbi:hypothetical protein BLOT_016718 [Blomia tropicalis]|nr:hypothetical protein BLOT_016718 [Blomia tropicalis]
MDRWKSQFNASSLIYPRMCPHAGNYSSDDNEGKMYTNDTSTKSKMTMEHERVAVTIIEDDDDDYGGKRTSEIAQQVKKNKYCEVTDNDHDDNSGVYIEFTN